jgi:branched-chain amino acid transport system substrate-binding protein
MTQTGKTTTIIIVILIVIGVIIGMNRGGKIEEQANKEPIKIGAIAPLTGDAAVYGEPARNVIQMAVDEINAAGGIKGQQIELIFEDGKCNGKDGASAAQKLANVDKVQVIIERLLLSFAVFRNSSRISESFISAAFLNINSLCGFSLSNERS